MIGILLMILGAGLLGYAITKNPHKEYEPNKWDLQSRMADIGFWLFYLGGIILIWNG